MREQPLPIEPREKLKQRMADFAVFLKPPYTFVIPKNKRVELENPNKEYYICRNNVLTLVLGRLSLVFNDRELPLREKERVSLKEIHDKIADIAKGPDKAAKMRTTDEMHYINSAMEDAFAILKEAAEREPDAYQI